MDFPGVPILNEIYPELDYLPWLAVFAPRDKCSIRQVNMTISLAFLAPELVKAAVTWPIRSKRFRAFLRRSYYQATGEAASASEIRSALDLLEARAQFDGPERIVHIRTAEHAGHIYLDLADEHWRAVDIGPEGWRVVESPPRALPPARWDVAAART